MWRVGNPKHHYFLLNPAAEVRRGLGGVYMQRRREGPQESSCGGKDPHANKTGPGAPSVLGSSLSVWARQTSVYLLLLRPPMLRLLGPLLFLPQKGRQEVKEKEKHLSPVNYFMKNS